MIRLWLDEEHLRDLVRGRVVEIRPDIGEPIDIMLADLGSAVIQRLLNEAMEEAERKRWAPP